MIWQELLTASAKGGGDGGGGRQTEAEPRGKTEIIVTEHELRPRGGGHEPAGGPCLPQTKKMRGEREGAANRAREAILDG